MFSNKKQKGRWWIWTGGEVGSKWEEQKEGHQNQDILCEEKKKNLLQPTSIKRETKRNPNYKVKGTN